MNIEIIGRDYEVTEGIREYVSKRLNSFDAFLDNEKVDITLEKEGNLQKISLFTRYDGSIIKIEEVDADLYVAIDELKNRLWEDLKRKKDIKIEKEREKTRTAKGLNGSINTEKIEDKDKEVIKRKVFFLKPMFEEEAILQMELLGHDFFVFLNAETNETNVIYQRKDGQYGVIETELA